MANLTKLIIIILLSGCASPEKSEQEKLRELNAKGEFIYRKSNEVFYTPQPLKVRVLEPYSWESAYEGKFPKITKEFFRCRGNSSNPPIHEKDNPHFDCEGAHKHSLPLKNGKEYIYPVLLDLLNYLQAKTAKKVIITCGHRCPTHNSYADRALLNQSSKHMMGAEVDFYIQGMEEKPQFVVDLIMAFFKQTPPYKGKREYEEFLRYEKEGTNVSTAPWYNKEILIKLFKKQEGRDVDNQHPYPYVCIQVRFDREANEKVVFFWQKAFNGYRRN